MRIALIVAAALLLAGCYPTGIEPNEVDEQRLAALASESLLDGGTEHAAEPNRTSANANAKRASVYVERSWARDDIWPSTQQLVADLRADDWVIVLQNCKAGTSGLESAEIIALKQVDDFAAGMIVKLDTDGAALEAYAPFHEEDTNPWGALDSQDDGCLDGPVEPTDDTTTNTRSTVGPWYTRHE